MKKSKRWISAVVAAVMTCSVAAVALSGCGKKPEPEAPTYTYNEYISRFPSSWSTHNAQSDADMYVQKYTEMGLYAYSLSDDKTTFKFVDEMAVGNPVNVTSTYKGQYGITDSDAENTKAGKAWEITLNPDATWENGTAITADDYVWSMERVLSSEMKNKLATSYTTGEASIYKAMNYYTSGRQENYVNIMDQKLYDEDQLYALVDQELLYFSFDTPLSEKYGSRTLSAFHDLTSQRKHFLNADKQDIFDILYDKYNSQVNEYGYVKITRDNFNDFKTNLSVLSVSALKGMIPNWYVLLAIKNSGAPVYTKVESGKVFTDEELNNLINSGDLYFSFKTPISDEANAKTLEEHHNDESTKPLYNIDGTDVYEKLYNTCAKEINGNGYIRISQFNVDAFKTNLGGLAETGLGSIFPNWYSLCSFLSFDEDKVETTPFEEVGIFKTANDKFVIVFENALSQYQVKSALTSNWIVYKNYYENGYSQHGSLTLTNYGTTTGNYMGYGPYKLKNFEVDKQLIFVRNENWYGYKSDKTNYHANEYQTDKIVCKILSDPSTALLEFEKGDLDNVILSANDTDKYKFSDYMLKRSGSNTWTITLNSNLARLGLISKDGNNVRILSVPEFRKAISLSIDRASIAQNIVAGASAAYTFINENYYYDIENDQNSVYRNTDQAKKAVLDLYGIEYGDGKKYATLDDAYKAVSGYDLDSAKQNFIAAYEAAVDAGIYNDGDNVKISVYTTSLTQKFTAMINFIDQKVKAATEGTPLEGKVSLEPQQAAGSTVATDMSNGLITARYYSYLGDYANPNGMIENFTDPSSTQLQESGFDPKTESFEVTADFNGDGTAETVEDTFYNWQKSIAAGGVYATAGNNVKLEVLSALEYNLLKNFRTLPLCVIADVTLRSKKVNYATENANIFVAYGGVRLMTYKYSDAEWAEFCKNSNNLKYD